MQSESNRLPTHCNVLLHIVTSYDKFTQCFTGWSVAKTPEKDSLVLVMHENARVESGLLDVLAIQYPGRTRGPFLKNNTMTIEFIKDDSIEKNFDVSRLFHDNAKKRKRVDEPKRGLIESMKEVLLPSIRRFNTINADFREISSGTDARNKWVSFEIAYVDTLNTSFLQDIRVNALFDTIKNIYVSTGDVFTVKFVFFGENEMYMRTRWEFVLCPAESCIRSRITRKTLHVKNSADSKS